MSGLVPAALAAAVAPSRAQAVTGDPAATTGQPAPADLSDHLALVLAFEAAGGLDSNRPSQRTIFGGIKIGMPIALKGEEPSTLLRTLTLDLGYDRMQRRNGFSGELSMMLPVARFPRPRTPAATYARIYVEPGGGYRGGAGAFGGYASAKAMVVFFSDDRLTRDNAPPNVFCEIQRRFPVTAPLQGDTRVVVGLLGAICNHCG